MHVARFGVAGRRVSRAGARRAQRVPVLEWRDGELVSERGHGAELIWFPDPVGARECELVGAGIEQLVAAVPEVRRASVRLGLPHTPKVKLPGPLGLLARGRQDPGVGWGAVRAEVWGAQGDPARRSSMASSSAPRSPPARCWASPPRGSPAGSRPSDRVPRQGGGLGAVAARCRSWVSWLVGA